MTGFLSLLKFDFYEKELQACVDCISGPMTNTEISTLSGGLSNLSLKFVTKNSSCVVRFPQSYFKYIDRFSEKNNALIATALGINPHVIYCDAKKEIMVMQYIENSTPMTPAHFKNIALLCMAIKTLKQLHESGKQFINPGNVFIRCIYLAHYLQRIGVKFTAFHHHMIKIAHELNLIISHLNIPTVPCHNDTTPSNFTLSKNKMWLIDWEYSSNNDPIYDLAYLALEARFDTHQENLMFSLYFGQIDCFSYSRFHLYQPFIEFWVSLWANMQMVNRVNSDKRDVFLNLEKTRLINCKNILAGRDWNNATLFLKNYEPIPH